MNLPEIHEFLGCRTPDAWVQAALADQETLLIDHKNCEFKAASTALSLMAKYYGHVDLINMMSRLAREEPLTWWNPAAEAQAIDRTHRIGQDKPVMVYRMVSADTIEEKVVALQERKRDLFAKVVGEAGDLAAPLTADDIRGLLEV